MPFQTIETVNESSQERQRTLDFFSEGRDPGWRNRLVWGDKKYVLPALLPDFQGKIDLVYIDPPFATGADFSVQVEVGDQDFNKEPTALEQKAYRDTWGRGLDSYLAWFYEAAVFIYDLLAPTGSLYVHLDWHVSHAVKTLLDEVFGSERFMNEVVWQRTGAHSDPQRYGNVHDTILFYVKGDKYTWNPQYTPYTGEYISERFRTVEEGTGRRYWLNTLTAGGGPSRPRKFFGKERRPPVGTHWRFSQERIDELAKDDRIVVTKSGMPYIKQYLDESPGRPLQTIWPDVPMSKSGHERTGYATQKPEGLLQRIIESSSNPGDLVLDCFVGSGTTAVAAEKLGRRWIVGDVGRFAVHTTRKRLLSLEDVRPFVVQNLGKYERQAWQVAEFGGSADSLGLRYRMFILSLYRATPVTGYNWIHGMKSGRAVHVGAVDAPVSVGDVQQLATELAKLRTSSGAGPIAIDVLGWDFAFELNEVAKQQAARAGIDLRFFRIPHDVMDKRAVAQGDISFYELAALAIDLKKKARGVTVTLTDFVIPLDDVPDDVQKAVKDWSEWIDYWAIDWDNRDDTFHNVWQSYRSRATPTLERTAMHTYDAPGQHKIVVKVIDILGNDTTKTISIQVK